MSSGRPPVPCGRGRSRGPQLPATSSDASRIGGAMMLDYLLGHRHLRRPASSLLYQKLLQSHHHHNQSPHHQRASTSASMMLGTLPPPMAVSEVGASGAPTLLVREMKITYWWDCDNKSMFRVFHIFAGKYIQKTFSVVRSSLVKPLWLANEI
ncbi:UNVERIFIED_CONTAM: hypothetical protein Sradi_3364100 [Sesamum radiatum]|uniref:Uncharacterized protein n=1 Tax=Sesamum radiatum TaxID=300843 RepID=A0AAW2R343_SESRA